MPDERLRLVPRPAELGARLATAGPDLPVAGLVKIRWPEEAPRDEVPAAIARAHEGVAADPTGAVNARTSDDVRARADLLPAPAEDPALLAAIRRARELGVRHVPIVDPCLDASCATRALDVFRLALDRAAAGRGLARIVHLGDSTISSDGVSGTVRSRLAARFGDGGRGYLYVDGPTRYRGQLRRAGKASPGWEIRSLAGPLAEDGRYGMGGASFEAHAPGERVTFATRGSERFDLHYLARPGGGRLRVTADGAPLGTVDTSARNPAIGFASFRLPAEAASVAVVAETPARVFGAVLERDGAGVVYDTLGIPGAAAAGLLAMDEADLAAALRRRRPDLVIVMLGMNESHTLKDEPEDLDRYADRERALLALLRHSAPATSCLVVSPLDGGRRDGAGGAAPRPILGKIRDIQRSAARQGGCAFWDLYEAMGGEGSMGRWLDAGLALPDLSHPTDDGGRALGYLLSEALLAAYRGAGASISTLPGELPGTSPGLEDPGALASWFQALAAVEAGDPGASAVAIQLGDTDTAEDHFPSQLRRRLAATFGSAGRGLVFPGPPFRTPPPADVATDAAGFVTLEGLTGTAPPVFGPSGVLAAAAFAGDEAEVASEETGPFARVGAFEVHYLVDPFRGGTLILGLDGRPVEIVDTRFPGGGRADGLLGTVRLEVDPAPHRLSLRPAGDGEVALLGVVLSSDRPGTVWESAGLSGATAATPLEWELPLFHAQLASRRPRLVALAYGTNEALAPDFDPDAYRQDFGRLVARIRDVAREASCLVIGPPDLLVDDGGEPSPAPDLPWIILVQRELAAREGCAFWDARAAMGGAGAMARWRDVGHGRADGARLSPTGARRLGDLLFEDLVAAYRAHREGS